MIYPSNFESKTEFTNIRKLLQNYCLSNLGKSNVNLISFSSDIKKIKTLLYQTNEFKNILLFAENFVFSSFPDNTESFDRIKNIGTFFIESELLDIRKVLNSVKSLLQFFNNDDENKYPELKKLTKEVENLPEISKEIDKIIDRNGNIKDNASPKLADYRKELSHKRSNVSRVMHKILDTAKNKGIVEKDCEITIRDSKMLIPVPAAYKRQINGFIHDESATGKTSFIEPIEIVEVNNKIRELEFAERRELIKILTDITNYIRPRIYQILDSYNYLGKIDFIRAKGLLAIETEGVMPNIKNQALIEFKKARHPLLFMSFKNTNRTVVSSDFSIDENNRVILISGPNAGGKSVALKTVGLLQYMLQCGLLIPINSVSETGIFNKIFIDIGDEQSIENDLSTYSSHLMNMKFFTKNADDKTLILIDEFGTGTEPLLGGAIAESVLEKLNSLKTRGVITTHYSNIKKLGSETEGIVNAAMLFDLNLLKPLYKLEIGHAGSSFAFEIAGKTGISHDIIQNAKNKVDKNKIDYEKVLKQTLKEKRKLEKKTRNIRHVEKKLEETLEKYETELNKTLSNRKEIIKEQEIKSSEIVNQLNKKIENTIYKIKQSNADNEKTKELRKELEIYTLNEFERRKKEEQKINAQIEKIKNKKKKKKEKKEISEENIVEVNEEEIILKIGDVVKIKGQSTAGEVLKISNNKILIAFGTIKMNVKKENILKLNNAQIKAHKKTSKSGVTIIRSNDVNNLSFMNALDVRGKRSDEAIHAVSDFVDNAIVARTSTLRILHGTGNGILRANIRDFLRSHQLVKSFNDERLEAGGAGITVIHLDY